MLHLSEWKYRFRGATEAERTALSETAHRMIPGSSLPMYLRDYSWWIHQGDLRLPSNVINDINLIVTGDLIVDGWYDDYPGEGLLAVCGSMRCRHVFSWYFFHVGRDLLVQGLNLQYYNDWVFECGGQLAARAFIAADKACLFDRERTDLEGFYYSLDCFGPDSSRFLPYRMLGLLDGNHNPLESDDASAEEYDTEDEYDVADEPDDYDPELPDTSEIIAHVKAADADGRSPFVTPEPLPATIWREALHADTSLARLLDLAESHGWDVAMRPTLPPELQDRLAAHDDARVRWALALSPAVQDGVLRRLASDNDPLVRAAVASHARCPGDLWVRFASDLTPEVRAAVVHAHGTGPAPWVIPLAEDASAHVRRAVAVIRGLPAAVVATLSNDVDTRVKNRILTMQPQTPDMVRTQFDSPDESVRLGLASAAVYGNSPFSHIAAEQGLRNEALMRFMLDVSARVRAAAAVHFLPPTFYEANARQFALDEVDDVRRAFAHKTRQAEWLAQLAIDNNVEVRKAVATNPNTPPDTLRRMAEAVEPLTYDLDGSAFVAHALLENPRLPADAVARLYEAYPIDADIGPHPNAPMRLIIHRVCNNPYNSEDDPEHAIHQRCLRLYAGGRPPSAQELDTLFRDIAKARPYELTRHALANAACPSDIAANYVAEYLRKQDKDGCYEMKAIAANPALPFETVRKLAAYLLTERDHEVQEGLLRNPACPADVLAALAMGAADEKYYRNDARDALWQWHGIVESDIPHLTPARLDDVAWRDA